MAEQVLIKKADGKREVFKEEKLRRSLQRAGADEGQIEKVVEHIISDTNTHTTTSEIHRKAFNILSQMGGASAAKYSLKRAIMQLGPSGFPFERFMAQVLTERGYKTQIGVEVQGSCAKHEVDIIAENDKEVILIEAKFHNRIGVKSDMKVVLYIHARYMDLHEGGLKELNIGNKKESFWLVTNTKFTKNSIQYGKCKGLIMIGWSYPREGNLQDLVESSGLQPLTCLTSLRDQEKKHLLNKGIVLCKSILEKPSLLTEAGLSKERSEKAITELKDLYNRA